MSYYSLNNFEIAGISSALPANKVENFGELYRVSVDKQTASDLGFEAASQILEKTKIDVSEIGLLIFLSRTPDYRSPATSMVLQHRLGLDVDTFVYDINSGGIAMFHGIQTAGSILESLNTSYALVIFGDTPSKQIKDKKSFPLRYSDAASAILLKKSSDKFSNSIGIISDSSKFDAEINVGGAFRFYDIYSKDRSKMFDNDYLKLNYDVKSRFYETCQKKHLKSFLDKTEININEIIHFISGIKGENDKEAEKTMFDTEIIADHAYGRTIASEIPLKLANHFSQKEGYIIADASGEGLSYGMMVLHVSSDIIFETVETDNYFSNAEVSHNI